MSSNPDNVGCEWVRVHSDQRGIVFEPLTSDELSQQRNVHVVLTAPNCIRGNHFHRYGSEILTVIGPALVRLREMGCIRDLTVPAGSACKLRIPAGVSHAFKNLGTTPMVLIAFNTSVHDADCPDVVRDELIVL